MPPILRVIPGEEQVVWQGRSCVGVSNPIHLVLDADQTAISLSNWRSSFAQVWSMTCQDHGHQIGLGCAFYSLITGQLFPLHQHLFLFECTTARPTVLFTHVCLHGGRISVDDRWCILLNSYALSISIFGNPPLFGDLPHLLRQRGSDWKAKEISILLRSSLSMTWLFVKCWFLLRSLSFNNFSALAAV
jgi:hypothetical protein